MASNRSGAEGAASSIIMVAEVGGGGGVDMLEEELSPCAERAPPEMNSSCGGVDSSVDSRRLGAVVARVSSSSPPEGPESPSP